MTIKDQLQELRQLVRLHANWLTVKLLGKDAVSATEYEELRKYGKLPLDENINLVEKSYILGRLRALLKPSEYRDLSYEEVVAHVDTAQLTSVEELVLEEAKLHAATHIRGLADDIAAGAFSRLSETLTESAVQSVIRDQTALAIQQKLSYQKLASNIAKELKDSWSRDWRRVAETELHRAKIHGQAHAILNRVGLYERVGGPTALVSVIPSPETCDDCDTHFLDLDGNPKVFRLQDLLGQGSNADPNVKHTRSGGKHAHWKTTLPPLHPSCGCSLVFVPPGMGWQAGKLQVLDEAVYVEELSKAVDTGSTAPVVKPPGPKSTQGPSTPKPASIPGAAAPGNTAGPGRPSSGGPQKEWEYYSGEGTPDQSDGWERSSTGKSWRRPKGSAGKPGTPEHEEAKQQLKTQEAIAWSKQGKPDDVIINHLKSGEISALNNLSEEIGVHSGKSKEEIKAAIGRGEVGGNELYRVAIDGNGRGVMKPPPTTKDSVSPSEFSDIKGQLIPGTEHKREQAAYALSSVLVPGLVPPTTERTHDDRAMSVQHWEEAAAPLDATLNKQSDEVKAMYKNKVQRLLHLAPDKDAMREKIHTVAVMDYIMANGDAHTNNILVSEDFTDLKSIDNGAAFQNGFSAKNGLARHMYGANMKLTIPDTLQVRMKNTSLGDLKRSLGDHLEDWEVGQTFLRTHYMLHLQDTEGELSYDKLGRTEWKSLDGETHLPRGLHPDDNTWSGLNPLNIFTARKEEGQLPSQLFESWAKAFVQEGTNDPSHPYHNDLKEINEIGVFMGVLDNHQEYRRAGKHREYENSISANKDLPKNLIKDYGAYGRGEYSPDESVTDVDLEPSAQSPAGESSSASTAEGGTADLGPGQAKDAKDKDLPYAKTVAAPEPTPSTVVARASQPVVRPGVHAASRARKERSKSEVSKGLDLYLHESLVDGGA